jgi:hypothetical protein
MWLDGGLVKLGANGFDEDGDKDEIGLVGVHPATEFA